MKHIFVTGITGLVGSGFLHFLIENNYDISKIIALCRKKESSAHIQKQCKVIIGSSFDNNLLDSIFQKYDIDTIVHISNKDQIFQFAELAAKYKVKKFIAISSTYVFSKKNHKNKSILNENKSINIFTNNNIEYIFLRPTSIFGTRPDGIKDRNISIFTKYVNKLPLFPLFGGGKAKVQPVWGRDVGHALFILLTNFDKLKNNAYTIGGDKERSFKELLKEIAISNSINIHFLYLPKWLGYFVFYTLFCLSFGKIDKRESIRRLLEDKSFSTSKELFKFGIKITSFDKAYSEQYVL